ncbi:MAG: Smr domain [Fibrobacteres bacterium]|nr:Smr domain [Fibrobacterota bacterium]
MGHKGKKRREPGEPKFPIRAEAAVEEEIDLHGLAIDEAMVQVELALARWRNRSGACIRVIHGKSSGTRESIKGMLLHNLETVWKGKVRTFRQEFGNPGSSLVFLS